MMKKLFVLFVLLVSFVAIHAQTTSKVLKQDQRIYTFSAAGSVAASGDQVSKVFDLSEKTSIQYYQVNVSLDTVLIPAETTSPHVTVYLKKSMDGSTYSNIDTATFYGSAADTSFVFQDISTGLYYPYLKIELNGADSIEISYGDVIGNFLDK